MKDRFIDFVNRKKYFLFFFFVLVLYNFIVVNKFEFFKVDEITYTYHIVDFSIGFVSKVLPGAIFTFLFGDVMPWQVNLIENILLFVIFAFTAHFLDVLISTRKNYTERCAFLVFSLFFVTGSFTFSTFVQELGMIDVYWLYFTMAFLLFVSDKKLYIFIPIVYILAVFIHFPSVTSYIILFSLIILYKISQQKHDRIVLSVILIISLAAAALLTLMFMKNETSNLNYTLDEFHDFLDSRYKMNDNTYYIYYDYAFYKVSYVPEYPFKLMSDDILITDSALPSVIVKFINAFAQQFHIVSFVYKTRDHFFVDLVCISALVLPVFAFLIRFWISRIRESKKENKFSAFVFFLMLMQIPVTLLFGNACSIDAARWFTHTLMIQFIMVIFVVLSNSKGASEWITAKIIKMDKKVLFAYWITYAILIFVIYS